MKPLRNLTPKAVWMGSTGGLACVAAVSVSAMLSEGVSARTMALSFDDDCTRRDDLCLDQLVLLCGVRAPVA